jgi:signal transduction histidine kinase
MSSALGILRLQDDFSSRSARAVGVIERQLAQMTRLVDDLREVSRISEGKLDLQAQEIEAWSFVVAAVETVRPQLDARRQVLIVQEGPEPLVVRGDAQRLTQVVVNLLNNASKYTDEGGRISVTLRTTADNVEIAVRDTGIGIPADMQTAIFDLFTQVDQHRDRSGGGLGIGLALVQRLVLLHGGTVVVRSDGPGTGSEFIVRLPRIVHAGAVVHAGNPASASVDSIRRPAGS